VRQSATKTIKNLLHCFVDTVRHTCGTCPIDDVRACMSSDTPCSPKRQCATNHAVCMMDRAPRDLPCVSSVRRRASRSWRSASTSHDRGGVAFRGQRSRHAHHKERRAHHSERAWSGHCHSVRLRAISTTAIGAATARSVCGPSGHRAEGWQAAPLTASCARDREGSRNRTPAERTNALKRGSC